MKSVEYVVDLTERRVAGPILIIIIFFLLILTSRLPVANTHDVYCASWINKVEQNEWM